MPASDLPVENNATTCWLSETLSAINTIREVLAVEIRNLESLSDGDRLPVRAPEAPLYGREYERLLRLRRIHAKLEGRERLLREACTFPNDQLPGRPPQVVTLSDRGMRSD